MQASAIPAKIQLPFAASGDKVTIPVPSQIGITDGRASFTTGFVPLNGTPLSAGGVAPFESDFNGIFNQITAVQQWQCAGGVFKYDAAFSAAIGGYPKGAILASSDGTASWLSVVDNNVTNPDTGGAGWTSNSAGRLLFVKVIDSTGTYTPSSGVGSVIVMAQAGGGGGCGAAATAAGETAVGGGGASGGFAIGRFSIQTIGASQAVTIGTGGAGGAGGTGGAGGQTTFGALLTTYGGNGGGGGAAQSSNVSVLAIGGIPGNNSLGGNIMNTSGITGGFGFNAGGAAGGAGAGSPIANGAGGATASLSIGAAGRNANAPGAGGGGAIGTSGTAAINGGSGAGGRVIIYEYS